VRIVLIPLGATYLFNVLKAMSEVRFITPWHRRFQLANQGLHRRDEPVQASVRRTLTGFV
jgi:hypothetical protein